MSWVKASILYLRDRYSDRVHLLSLLELRLDDIRIRLRIAGGKGAFRVHPRLPLIQVWLSIQEGYEYIRSMDAAEEKQLQSREQLAKIRAAKESVYRARQEGRTPRQEDITLANTRVEYRDKSSQRLQVQEVNLSEIYDTVLNQKNIRDQSETILPIGDNTPIKQSKRLPLRLVLSRMD